MISQQSFQVSAMTHEPNVHITDDIDKLKSDLEKATDESVKADLRKQLIKLRSIEKLAPILSEHRCQVCGNKNFTLSGVFIMLEYYGTKIFLGGEIMPMVPVVCTNCSNTIFFNAIFLGVVDD